MANKSTPVQIGGTPRTHIDKVGAGYRWTCPACLADGAQEDSRAKAAEDAAQHDFRAGHIWVEDESTD